MGTRGPPGANPGRTAANLGGGGGGSGGPMVTGYRQRQWFHSALGAALFLVAFQGWFLEGVAQSVTDEFLEQERERLLIAYSEFKNPHRADPPGADDDPDFQDFALVTDGAVTHRQDKPGLQLSFLNDGSAVGEVDLDFDSGLCGPFLPSCHCKPANSDVGSGRASELPPQHLTKFNRVFGFFSTNLTLSMWDGRQAHCQPSYSRLSRSGPWVGGGPVGVSNFDVCRRNCGDVEVWRGRQ